MKKTLLALALSVSLLSPALAAPDIPDLVAEFEPYAQKSLKEWGAPGMAVAILVGGQVVYSKGFGVGEEGGHAITPETVFQIGSISKSFTSALVGQLVDEGKLHWSDPVVDAFPEFQMYDPWVTREFTVEDTMSQRSGMAPYAGDFLAFLGRSRDEIIAAIRHIKPVSSVRSQFAYVNNMWLVAAKVIEAKGGKSWEEAVQQSLFQPLGMTRSSTGMEGLYGDANHATPHLREGRSATPLRQSWPFAGWVYTYGPAGGINSTVLDMARYAEMQLEGGVDGKTLLSEQTLQKLHSPHIYIGGTRKSPAKDVSQVAPASYCLGWLRQELSPQPLVWHNGGTSGSKSVIGLLPESDAAIVVLTNLGDTELPEALMYRFYDLYLERPEQDYSANFLKARQEAVASRPERPKNAAPAQALSAYSGTYRNDVYGRVEVHPEGKGLRAVLEPNVVMRMRPWNRDTFVFDDFINPADPPQFATFRFDNDGRVEALQIDPLMDSPGGLFLRVRPGENGGQER
jgi:CubicO group peptidase (beta-lactamase class C family)